MNAETPKSRAHAIAIKIGQFMLTLCGGGLLVFILGIVLQPSVDLRVLLTESLPSPTNHGRNQVLVIRNDGRKPAMKPIVTIRWPRTVQPLDYKIQASCTILEETRENAYLRFKMEKLPPADYVTVVMAVTGGHRIQPVDLRIVHDDGVVKTEMIEFTEPSKWRNAR